MDRPVKDIQTVTPEGTSVAPLIDGVLIREARTIADERGTICEMYNPAWGFTEEPLVYVYQTTIRPRRVTTRPYRHEDPDKYRLPLDTEEIPYKFGS